MFQRCNDCELSKLSLQLFWIWLNTLWICDRVDSVFITKYRGWIQPKISRAIWVPCILKLRALYFFQGQICSSSHILCMPTFIFDHSGPQAINLLEGLPYFKPCRSIYVNCAFSDTRIVIGSHEVAVGFYHFPVYSCPLTCLAI